MRKRCLLWILLALCCAGCELVTRVDPPQIDSGSGEDGGEISE